MMQNLNKKNKDKIYKALVRDYRAGNRLFYDALNEKPINAFRLSSAMFYLNKVTSEILKSKFSDIITQCEQENESKDPL